MEPSDESVNSAQTKLAAAYGPGASALPWQAIIAAILSMLNGCIPTPTPAVVKAQLSRPIVALRLFRRLRENGVPVQSIPQVIQAAKTAGASAADDELTAFISAAQETT